MPRSRVHTGSPSLREGRRSPQAAPARSGRSRGPRGRGRRARLHARRRRDGGDARAAVEAAGCTLAATPALVGQHTVTSPTGSSKKWNTTPPTSGPHYAIPVVYGMYDEPVNQAQLVHNLEHGAIAVQYGDDVRRRPSSSSARSPRAIRGARCSPRIRRSGTRSRSAPGSPMTTTCQGHRVPREVHGLRRGGIRRVLSIRTSSRAPSASRPTRCCPAAASAALRG